MRLSSSSLYVLNLAVLLSFFFRLRNDEAQVQPNPDVRRGWLQEAGRLSVFQERDRGGGESGDVDVWRAELTLAAVGAFATCLPVNQYINKKNMWFYSRR